MKFDRNTEKQDAEIVSNERLRLLKAISNFSDLSEYFISYREEKRSINAAKLATLTQFDSTGINNVVNFIQEKRRLLIDGDNSNLSVNHTVFDLIDEAQALADHVEINKASFDFERLRELQETFELINKALIATKSELSKVNHVQSQLNKIDIQDTIASARKAIYKEERQYFEFEREENINITIAAATVLLLANILIASQWEWDPMMPAILAPVVATGVQMLVIDEIITRALLRMHPTWKSKTTDRVTALMQSRIKTLEGDIPLSEDDIERRKAALALRSRASKQLSHMGLTRETNSRLEDRLADDNRDDDTTDSSKRLRFHI